MIWCGSLLQLRLLAVPIQRGKRRGRIDTVGFHQDSAYISAQFQPYANNSVTLWMALDDADEENGCVEYAVGSHKWTPILHLGEEDATTIDTFDTVATDGEISSFHSSDESSYRDGLSTAAALAGVENPLKIIEAAPVNEGRAIFHHQDVWHGSGPNLSTTRHRRALVAHYIRGDISFVEDSRHSSPFGNASYIYGRYKRYNSVELDESFFPVIYGDRGGGHMRTAWVDDFLAYK